MKISILDCTLRDGGYINDWEFNNKQILDTCNSLAQANVDIIECGYLNSKKGKTLNSTLFDSVNTVNMLLENIERKSQKVVMINFGDFDIDKLPCQNKTKIDGIRLAFHKKDKENALKLSKIIIDLGYKLYFQPMVTKNYKDVEFISLINEANKLDIYSFYIVDSFGSMTLEEFQKYMITADANLNKNIYLGYHSHNNMQLAFSNAINMCTTKLNRDIIVDASIYGVGRGAGNLNTELIADYLNTSLSKNYDTLPLLEIIDEFLSSLMKKKPWGFSPAQFLSASFNCHPNYATYLINKNTSHIVGVRKILEKLPVEKKLSFDEEFIEKLYSEFLLEIKTPVRGKLFFQENKKILLIASGKSVDEYKDTVLSKINNESYITVSLNHKPEFECDFHFFSNQKRFDEFKTRLSYDKTVITSNIFSNIELNKILDFKALVYTENEFVTNVAMVFINYLISQNIREVEIAGLDGYKIDTDNYNYLETSVINDRKELIQQNEIIAKSLKSLDQKIDIRFITPSMFNEEI